MTNRLNNCEQANVDKIIGTAYLIYLGIKQLKASKNPQSFTQSKKEEEKNHHHLFTESFFIAATNPKPILFFIALFPQFLVVNEPMAQQFAVLTGIFMMISFFSLCTYGYVSHGTPPVVLASPPQWPPKAPRSSQNGNFFTLCLTNPVGGLFSLCGREIGSVEKKGDNELTMKIKR